MSKFLKTISVVTAEEVADLMSNYDRATVVDLGPALVTVIHDEGVTFVVVNTAEEKNAILSFE